ncbi:pyruvate ferredoxin oxidoreductase [Desulfocarbo indianensis]|nr:pyruvate ferredoxin oxidoreductase [Desulfocarbo indianensis]
MARKTVNVMIGGEAGQGLVTIGNVLAKALVHAGYEIVVSQDYMSRVRGGHNTFVIRAAVQAIQAPEEGLDLLVALNQETLELHGWELKPGALVVADRGLTCGQAACFSVPYQDLTEGRYINTVALGVAACLLGLSQETVGKALEKQLGKKSQEVADKNADALQKAYAFCQERAPEFAALEPAPAQGERIMLGGNEAIGLGALAAGLKFLSFYPMTPATSVALTVIAAAQKMGVVAEQAEDEIAAINMALGASYAGAPAMVCTSGGGYALMTEGLSLAGITETPLVLVIAQRPGPATGLPTRTEQGDLDFALYGGHGEFPRAIFAPGDLNQCFQLTVKAFHLAENFQSPVFVLTDQYLADSYRGIKPFGLDGVQPVQAGDPQAADQGWDYERYALSPSGVSPRAIPGAGSSLVLSDSDEHDNKGHITELAMVRLAQHEKRLSKLDGLREEVIAPQFGGPESAETLLVSWGSSLGAVAEAAQRLNGQGRQTATCHFSQVWPLKPEQFLPRFEKAGRVVMVEMNAGGQLARLIRRETGFQVHGLINRYDGRPFTPDYILQKLAG